MLPDGPNPTEIPPGVNSPDRIVVDLNVLDHERRLRGWTKTALAEAMGVTKESISDIYRRRAVGPETFAKLTAALDANPPSEVALRLAKMSEREGAA